MIRGLLIAAALAGCSTSDAPWARVDDVTGTPAALAINPSSYLPPYIIYVATDEGVFSSDDGKRWTHAGPRNITSIASMPMAQVAFAGVDDGSVQLTKDGGETWEPTGGSPNVIVRGWIGVRAVGPLGAAADASGGASMVRGLAIGDTWSAFGPFGTGVGTSIAFGGGITPNVTVFVGVNGDGGGVFRSTNVGSDASTFAQTSLAAGDVLALASAPPLFTTVYAGTASSLFVSTDSGETWAPAGLDGVRVQSIALDPVDAKRISVGTDNGIYLSKDGGASWVVALPGENVLTLSTLNGTPSTIYAITPNGLYVSRTGGL